MSAMSLQLYTLAGSPFGWKVQLALTAKQIPYIATPLSPDRGDLGTPWFRALNPRGKLPVLVDGDFVLFESDAIVDYVNEAFPAFGPNLWPREARARARARRIALEATAYLYPPVRQLVLRRNDPNRERALVDEAKSQVCGQLRAFDRELSAPYFADEIAGGADFAVYPFVALVKRLHQRRPDEGLGAMPPGGLNAWGDRIEAMPGFADTYPPHWRT